MDSYEVTSGSSRTGYVNASGLAWKANWLLLAGDVQGLFTARYVTVSEGGVDTFFCFVSRGSVARPTHNQRPGRPVSFCTMVYLLHMNCRYQQAGEWTRSWVEMGRGGILDICSLQEYSRGGGGEGREDCVPCWTNGKRRTTTQGSRAAGREEERKGREFPIWSASALEGRNGLGSRQ